MATRLFRIGSAGTDTKADVKHLSSRTVEINRYNTFEHPIGTDYVVPALKTFYITKVRYWSSVASEEIALGYGDTGVNDTTAPTNPVDVTSRLVSLAARTWYEFSCMIPIPTGKYPFHREAGIGTSQNIVEIEGVELDA